MLRSIVLWVVTVLVFSACQHKIPPTAMPKKQVIIKPNMTALSAKQEFMLHRLFEMTNEEGFFYIDGHYYGVYEDLDKPPVEFGTFVDQEQSVVLTHKGVVFEYDIDVDAPYFLLTHSTRQWVLKPVKKMYNIWRPTTLFEAARYGTLEEFTSFIKGDNDLHRVDSFGNTVLMHASFAGNEGVMLYLLSKNMPTDTTNNSGMTALDFALQNSQAKSVQLLLNSGARIDQSRCEQSIDAMSRAHSLYMLPLLITHGFDISCNSSQLLFEVLDMPVPQKQKNRHLQTLLSYGIDINNFSTQTGENALMRAAANGDDMLVHTLIKNRIDIYAKDAFGRTALDYDSMYLKQPNPKIKALLNEAGLVFGKKTKIQEEYEHALSLKAQNNYAQALALLKELASTYKQKRFFQAQIDTVLAMPKPSYEDVQHALELHEYLYGTTDVQSIQERVKLLKKLLHHASKDTTRYGKTFHEKSRYGIYERIEKAYSAIPMDKNLSLAYDRLENLNKLQDIKPYLVTKRLTKNGMHYKGETLNNKAFGIGRITYQDGAHYYGQTIDFVRHGKGKLTYKDGTYYDGYFKNNKRHGEGLFTNKDNRLFLGEFSNDTLVRPAVTVR